MYSFVFLCVLCVLFVSFLYIFCVLLCTVRDVVWCNVMWCMPILVLSRHLCLSHQTRLPTTNWPLLGAYWLRSICPPNLCFQSLHCGCHNNQSLHCGCHNDLSIMWSPTHNSPNLFSRICLIKLFSIGFSLQPIPSTARLPHSHLSQTLFNKLLTPAYPPTGQPPTPVYFINSIIHADWFAHFNWPVLNV